MEKNTKEHSKKLDIVRRKKIIKMRNKNNRAKEKERKSREDKKRKLRKKLNRSRDKLKKMSENIRQGNKTSSSKAPKKSISKPKTIPDTRLTEPKKRALFRRIMLQMKYNRGGFDYIEDEYDELTRKEIEEYRKSNNRSDRKYYKEVQAYEDATDDVTVRKGWMAFKIGLVSVMLVSSIGLLNHTMQQIHDMAPEPVVIVTIQDATQEQKDSAMSEINLIKNSSEYSFENLTQEEQLGAVLRIPTVESKISVGRFKNSIIGVNLDGDQELLDEIVEEAFGQEEYATYSDSKKEDLRKLAYELLDSEKKEWTRDPIALKELRQRQEAERLEREANMAEVEKRLNGKSQIDEELDDR